MTPHGHDRVERIASVLGALELDGLVCTLPTNILMLSGYWPVVGTAIAVAMRDGQVIVLAPEDEEDLARQGWASEVRTFQPGSLEHLTSPSQAVVEPLAAALSALGVASGHIAYEDTDAYEPVSYAAMYLYGPALATVLGGAAPGARLTSAAPALSRLRAALTTGEVDRVRLGCQVAERAFAIGREAIVADAIEAEVAAAFATPLSCEGLVQPGVARAGGFVYCMSGPNSALAGGAYARTRARRLQRSDLVLVHCNSYIDGYWTDITRTYCLGEPDERQRAMYDAVTTARAAALAVIKPGVAARDVDRAARDVLDERGFGRYFTHGLGHNIGFSAISAEYPPRIHPASDDRLEIGMTFNVEPSIYIHGYGGMRHCDVVTVTTSGVEVLTPFDAGPDGLVIQ